MGFKYWLVLWGNVLASQSVPDIEENLGPDGLPSSPEYTPFYRFNNGELLEDKGQNYTKIKFTVKS